MTNDLNAGSGNAISASQGTVLRSGIVLPKKHPTDASLYYVSFGEKTTSSTGRLDSGIWCNNSINGFVRYKDINNNSITYGSYTPIQPYTPVNVLMANGGVGVNSIIGFQPTNTSVPDINNVDGLHILGETPNGSTVRLDDKLGHISMIYNRGESMLSLGEDTIALELPKGAKSGKEGHTGIFMRKGAIVFKLPDSQLQFDETGLSVSFDDGGTYVKITKKSVVMEGMENFKVASTEQTTVKGSKLTLEGVKDASLSASELKVGGKQLTTISGSQINVDSMFAISLKSLAINFFALSKIQTFASMSDSTILGTDVRTAAVIADSAASHNVVSGSYARLAGINAIDGPIVQNMGLGAAIAPPTYVASKAMHVAVHAGLTALGTSMLVKVLPITIVNKILADTIAGTSEPAMEPSGSAAGAKDKNDKKSYGSVLATQYLKNNRVMEKYTVATNLLASSAIGKKSYGSSSSAISSIISNSASPRVPTNVATRPTSISKISKFSGKSTSRKG